jgi:DNA polymerase III epsilon subunit-like protein
MKNILNRSDRKIAILDVEASALEAGSYPIEVGVALVRRPSEPIAVGAKLIRPTQEWLDAGAWSNSSEAVHGIPLERVKREGEPVEEVCNWLNGFLGTDTIVATDAPRYDQDWLDTLFAAAGREQKFRIFDFKVLTRDFSADQHRHLAYLLGKDAPPHRAAEDALRLASKLMETHWGHPPHKGRLPTL